ncbi:Ubiquitin carboxyl-terminal hydrolase 16 [Psilocybe cubensis]|nr:Ubiquitin carboxyl-terminal hydrolase 16 [Psilocybe cubensis]KAH9477774.1 Ubiquitin carboxyl-terminal hydrolase 16 [Psilocybe cubensis]
MNSVLQGLIATRLLSDLVHFDPIPAEIQRKAATPIISRRSPQLTNGHNLAGPYEHAWVNSMPIGDMFLTLVYKAWDSQRNRRRDTLSPKSILNALGQKYDQYLDFAQQDAHEFLRILLDAMRMEEQDIIKTRQPPPPKLPKKRRRTTITSGNPPSISVPESSSKSTEPASNVEEVVSTSIESSPDQAKDPKDDVTLLSFADMLFSGQLTSILVCQKCKHVSQTYEEFNDISLSIKAEDYLPHNRKRDRFKKIVGRLTAFPGSSSQGQSKDSRKLSAHLPLAPNHLVEMQRSSSVPPSPRTEREIKQLGTDDEQHVSEPPRRRSLDVPVGVSVPDSNTPEISHQTLAPAVEVIESVPPFETTLQEPDRQDDGGAESEHSHILVNVTGPDDKHVEFIEPKIDRKDKGNVGQSDSTDTEDSKKDHGSSKEKSKQDDSWAKIGRRISMSVGLGRPKGSDKDKDKKVKDRKSRSMDRGGGLGSHMKEIKEAAIEVADLGIQKSLSAIVPPSKSAKEVTSDTRRISSDGRSAVSSSTEASSSGIPSSKPSKTLPNPSISSQSNNSLAPASNSSSAVPSIFPHVQRSKSPKPPKPSNAEAEYLRKILADVAVSSSSNNPFAIFKPPLLHNHSGHNTRPLSTHAPGGLNSHEKSAGATWLGIGIRNLSGLEECLRMFTAVEVLDGDNMVGCRRCWKIQNGMYHGTKEKDSDQEDQEEEEDRLPFEGGTAKNDPMTVNGVVNPPAKKIPHPLQVVSSSLSASAAVHIPTSISTPTVSMFSQADVNSDTRSISSLPTATTSASDLSLGQAKESDDSGDSQVSLSAMSEGSSSASANTKVERSGPGGMPIPVISTTSPPETPQWPTDPHNSIADNKVLGDNADANRSASYARLIGATSGPVPPSIPTPNPKLTQALYGFNTSSGSKDSLLIPQIGRPKYQKRRSYAESTFTDNDSSGDESDTSIGTSVSADSLRSSGSQNATIASSLANGTKSVPESSATAASIPQAQATKVSPPKKAPKPPKPVIMRPAYKRYLIAVPPPVLVIHFKRFQQTAKTPLMSFSHGFKKLEDYVSFPEHLDLLPFLAPRKEDYGLGKKGKGKESKVKEKEESCMYRLYAVVVHIGNMLGGHYIAYTALPDNLSRPARAAGADGDGKGTESTSDTAGQEKADTNSDPPSDAPKPASERQWAYISDTTVRLTTLEEVLHAKAYICMYERC